jgi:RNA polymerase sigma-70 factor (ECF subfamily)
MTQQHPDTEKLLVLAAAGDRQAIGTLLQSHCQRLCSMVAWHLDRRLAPRLDPSDVVQESLKVAAQRLPDFARDRPMPLYPWLRQITWECLVNLYNHHRRQKRDVAREEARGLFLSDDSVLQVAERFMARGSSPSQQVLRREAQNRLREALGQMSTQDREVLVMWYLEELSVHEIALLLNLSEGGVKSRHRRALERLVKVLAPYGGGYHDG